MELDISTTGAATRKRRRRLELILLVSFVLCLLVGLSALGALLLLRNGEPATAENSPLSLIRPDEIVSELALQQLSGAAAEPLAYQAINAGELETALAILVFSSDMPSQPRSVLFERLPRRYRDLGQDQRAAEATRLTRSIAMLDPRLPTMERAQLLTLSAEILVDADEFDAARDAVNQAKRIGEQAPDLLPAQRSRIFEALRPLALALNAPLLVQEIGELVRNPLLDPRGEPLQTRLFTLSEPVDPNPALTEAVQARQVAASALISRIFAVRGSVSGEEFVANIAPERAALSQALQNEDRIRSEYLDTTINDVSLGQQLTLLRDYRSWLALKARVAHLGFGLSLVPEWENERETILQELTTITNGIRQVADGFLNSLETPVDNASLRVETLVWLALQYELGLAPYVEIVQLDTDLRFAQDELERQQNAPVALPIFYDQDATPPGFRISAIFQP
jgi:hypothetical protein